jgi:hypothetical protein
MRRFLNALRSRVRLILAGAVVTMLVLPAAAVAGGFSAPNGMHRLAEAGSEGTGGGGGDGIGLPIFIGIAAVFVLSVVLLSRVRVQRTSRRREAKSIRHKPAGVAS